ncbi:MAG TPA: helix-hairpin-helix domain-containing protein [Clostridia bacterium]|nr:helix-hairpin-helix domain-containing protein [Clostridia bacterium]
MITIIQIQNKHIKFIAIVGIIMIGTLSSIIFKDSIFHPGKPGGVEVVPRETSSEVESRDGINGGQQEDQSEPQMPNIIKIYITGQVRNPGVIEVPAESRLIEAAEMAGGFLDEADLLKINLALRVQDEGMYIIPKIGEEGPEINSAGAIVNEGDSKIDINTADQKQLETLPRIGPVIAGNIINYREQNGIFKTEEDLMNVPGIGQKTFDGLKDFIRIK